MAGRKGKMQEEILSMTDPAIHPGDKPTIDHVEHAKQPYWDTEEVIGAQRNLTRSSSTEEDKVQTKRPGCMMRFWLHYKRHWKLYTVLAILGAAILLPIL